MAQINLLKNELEDRPAFSLGGIKSPSFYAVLGILIVEALVYGGLIFYNQQLTKQISQAQQQTAVLSQQISQAEQSRLAAVSAQSRLNNLQVLLQNHLYWSAVMTELEQYTYKSATYTTLQAAEGENKLLLSGRILSYTDLAKLILGLKTSPNIQDVVLKSSGQKETTQGGYSFDLEITFNPKLLLK